MLLIITNGKHFTILPPEDYLPNAKGDVRILKDLKNFELYMTILKKTTKLHPLKPFTCIFINNKGLIV